ncbi:hypothetical protein P9112_012577 [Eukaryota sp. TZLM1-RC]
MSESLRDHHYYSYIPHVAAPSSNFSSSLPPFSSSITPKPLGWLLSFVQKVYDTRRFSLTSPSGSHNGDSPDTSVPQLCRKLLSSSLAKTGRELLSSIKRFSASHPEVALFGSFLNESIPLSHFNSFVELRHLYCSELDRRRPHVIHHVYLSDPSISIEQTYILLSSLHVPSSEWRSILLSSLGELLSRSLLRDSTRILRRHVLYELKGEEKGYCTAFALLAVMFSVSVCSSEGCNVPFVEELPILESSPVSLNQSNCDCQSKGDSASLVNSGNFDRQSVEIVRLERVIAEKDNHLDQKEDLIRQLQSKIKILSQSNVSNEQLTVALNIKERKLIEKDEAIQSLNDRLAQKVTEVSELTAKYKELEGLLFEQNDTVRSLRIDFHGQIQQLNSTVNQNEELIESLGSENQKLKNENESLMMLIEHKQEQINDLEDTIKQMEVNQSKLMEEKRDLLASFEKERQRLFEQQEEMKKAMQESLETSIEELSNVGKETVVTLQKDHNNEVAEIKKVIAEKQSIIDDLIGKNKTLQDRTVEAAHKLQEAAQNLQGKAKNIVKEMVRKERAELEEKLSELTQIRAQMVDKMTEEVSSIAQNNVDSSREVAAERDEYKKKFDILEFKFNKLKLAYAHAEDLISKFDLFVEELLSLLRQIQQYLSQMQKWHPKASDSLLTQKCRHEAARAILSNSLINSILNIHFQRVTFKNVTISEHSLFYTITVDGAQVFKSAVVQGSTNPLFPAPPQKKLKSRNGLVPSEMTVKLFIKKGGDIREDRCVYTDDICIPKMYQWSSTKRVPPEIAPFIIIYRIGNADYWNPTGIAVPEIPVFPDVYSIPKNIFNEKPEINLVKIEEIEKDPEDLIPKANSDVDDLTVEEIVTDGERSESEEDD